MVLAVSFSLDQLIAFQTASTARSFSDTARKLGKAQSAVSSAISDLEIDLGVQLFDRSRRYPRMTVEGQTLLQEVDAILAHCSTLREQAAILLETENHGLRIATEDAVPGGLLASLLADLQSRFAGLQVAVDSPGSADIIQIIRDGKADFGLGCARSNYPQDVYFVRIGNVTLTNVVQADHPLASLDHVRFSHLRDHTRLALRGQSDGITTSEYLTSPRCILIDSQSVLLELLREGAGWATVPRRLVERDIAAGTLIEIRLDAYPRTEWRVGIDLLWKAGKPLTAVGTRVKSYLSAGRSAE